jgi:transposase
MWKPYLGSASYFIPQALHILDRFHIVKQLNEAIDTIRREETRARAAAGLDPLLKAMR